jgi:hypothetical protein
MTDFPNTTTSTSVSDLRAVVLHAMRTVLARLRRRTRATPHRGLSSNTTLSSADAATHLHLRICGARQRSRF